MSRAKLFAIMKITLALSSVILAVWYILNGDFGDEVTLREGVLFVYILILSAYCCIGVLEDE